MLFSDKIKQLRIESGKRQKDLARAIGVDVPAYSRYEHGERRPKREQVLRLARIFKTDPDELVAMWLADEAYSHIAHDKMASRASHLLNTMLGHPEDAEPSEGAVNLEKPEHDENHPERDLIKKMGHSLMPHLIQGDAATVMQRIEDESIDCIVTTPPYWRRRNQGTESITATNAGDFVEQILKTMEEAKRVLRPRGSLWLNMGDDTTGGFVQGIPWRVVLAMIDRQGWKLVNEVVWNKTTTSPQGSRDHLRKIHEFMFHLVKNDDFYYNDDELRRTWALLVKNDMQQSGSKRNVTGERYMKKIMETDALTPQEKNNAKRELNNALRRLNAGDINDLRLFLRESRDQAMDGNTPKARAINNKGFYIQTHSVQGTIPGDVWEIAVQRSGIEHYSVAPDTLYRLPMIASCPHGGIVLDPYCGTGTSCRIAYEMNLRSIGIDINPDYVKQARSSIEQKPLSLF